MKVGRASSAERSARWSTEVSGSGYWAQSFSISAFALANSGFAARHAVKIAARCAADLFSTGA
jgi:hypothetical protein